MGKWWHSHHSYSPFLLWSLSGSPFVCLSCQYLEGLQLLHGEKNRCVLLLWCSPNLLEDSCVVTRHGLHLKPFDVVSLKTYIVESLCKSCGKTAAGISKETVGHDLYHQAVNVKIILML